MAAAQERELCVATARFDKSCGNIPFVRDLTDTTLLDVPELDRLRIDDVNSAIGVPLTARRAPQVTAAVLLLRYAISVTPPNTPYRTDARRAWDSAARILSDRAPSKTWDDNERALMIGRSEWLHASFPIDPELHQISTEKLNPAYTSTNPDYNYRARCLLDWAPRYADLPDTGVLPDTNGQVSVDLATNTLWVKVYSEQNVRGFHPDRVASFAKHLIEGGVAWNDIHLGCVMADIHAWAIHRYADAPSEQSLDISMALNSIGHITPPPVR